MQILLLPGFFVRSESANGSVKHFLYGARVFITSDAQVLPEREVRAIAAQVMAGLVYLNEPPNRIMCAAPPTLPSAHDATALGSRQATKWPPFHCPTITCMYAVLHK